MASAERIASQHEYLLPKKTLASSIMALAEIQRSSNRNLELEDSIAEAVKMRISREKQSFPEKEAPAMIDIKASEIYFMKPFLEYRRHPFLFGHRKRKILTESLNKELKCMLLYGLERGRGKKDFESGIANEWYLRLGNKGQFYVPIGCIEKCEFVPASSVRGFFPHR